MLDAEQWRDRYNMMLGLFPGAVHWRHPEGAYYSAYQGTIFAWDQYFDAIVQMYLGLPPEYQRTGLDIFLQRQADNGHGPRSVRAGGQVYEKHNDPTQPFLCQSARLLAQRIGDFAWLERGGRYARLKKYLDYWLDHEDRRGAGLSVWQHAGATGMDNQYERAGRRDEDEFICEGADLNAYLVRECAAMAVLAKALGHEKDADSYESRGEARSAAIRRWLWDANSGFYYDFHAREERPIRVKSVAGFAPLWAGVPSEDEARRLVSDHLRNPGEFHRPYPVPALAADEPGYTTGFLPGDVGCSWRAFTWAPTNYFVFQGLRRYGFEREARELAERSEDLLRQQAFCEYYSSEHGIGSGRKPFLGWTGLFLFMRRELDLGINPTEWREGDAVARKMRAWLESEIGWAEVE